VAANNVLTQLYYGIQKDPTSQQRGTQVDSLHSLTHLQILLPRPDPLLEQVLVERVAQRAHRRVCLAPFARLGAEVVGVETLGPRHALNHLAHLGIKAKK
jgi:hypothetical protein